MGSGKFLSASVAKGRLRLDIIIWIMASIYRIIDFFVISALHVCLNKHLKNDLTSASASVL